MSIEQKAKEVRAVFNVERATGKSAGESDQLRQAQVAEFNSYFEGQSSSEVITFQNDLIKIFDQAREKIYDAMAKETDPTKLSLLIAQRNDLDLERGKVFRNLSLVINSKAQKEERREAVVVSPAARAELESDQSIRAKNAKNEAEANQVTPTRDEPAQSASPQPQKISFAQLVRNAIQSVQNKASEVKQSIDQSVERVRADVLEKRDLRAGLRQIEKDFKYRLPEEKDAALKGYKEYRQSGHEGDANAYYKTTQYADAIFSTNAPPLPDATMKSISDAANTAKDKIDAISSNAQQRLEVLEARETPQIASNNQMLGSVSQVQLDELLADVPMPKEGTVISSQELDTLFEAMGTDQKIDTFVNDVKSHIDATEKEFTDKLLVELEGPKISDAKVEKPAPSTDASKATPQQKGAPNKSTEETLKKSPDQLMAELDKALNMLDEPAKTGPAAGRTAKVDVPIIPSPRGSR